MLNFESGIWSASPGWVEALQSKIGSLTRQRIFSSTTELAQTPPVRKMLELGLPVGDGTDSTRVSSYNPWLSLEWLVTGKSVGGYARTQTTSDLKS